MGSPRRALGDTFDFFSRMVIGIAILIPLAILIFAIYILMLIAAFYLWVRARCHFRANHPSYDPGGSSAR